jgi:hypothetical protein
LATADPAAVRTTTSLPGWTPARITARRNRAVVSGLT